MAINFPNNPAVNDTFTVGGTKFTFTGDKWESGAVVELSSDITPQLSGELNAGSHNINNAGVITATAFHGDGSNLTGITDAAANTYGNATAVPQIVVGANGRITGITNVSISGGGGGGGSSIILKNNQSLVGAAGTIDFGTGLSVSTISAGVGTVTVNGSQVDAGSVGGSALTALQKNDADTDLVMNNQILHFGAANTKSRIRWSGTTSLWDLVDGDLKFRDNLTDRFTFERTTGNFITTGTVTTGTINISTAGGAGSNLSGDGRLTLQFPSGGGGGVGMFSVYSGTSKNIELFSGGSATFAGTISDSMGPLRRLGINAHNASTYTLVAGDAGKLVREATNGATITIPQNVFSAGDMISIFNVSTGNNTIAQGSGVTLYNTNDASTGNRTLGPKGVCTIVCTSTNEFIISGTQLT
jgi:hypothetical protein